MAHRALTLKYRPQVFADMVGQDHVIQVLARALESKRVAHAYLFTGARGVGKTTCARLLAKALDCERRASGEQPGPDPCNRCRSCEEITSGVSLDVAEIDGASNRGIADVQALREKVRFTPTGGRYRVVIIDEVHQLSNDAFAALLKTLEEPPPHLVFIFATTDPQKLPDTIRSRTQRFDFARVPLRKVADRLLDIQRREAADSDGMRFALTEGAALLIAHKSEGSMRDAVGALDQVVSAGETEVDEALVRRVLGIADREVFFALAEAITRGDAQATLRRLVAGFDKGLDARELAAGLGEHFRHVLVLKVDPGAEDLVALAREDLDRLRAQGESWSEHDLLRLVRITSDVLVAMKESPQPLVLVEAAVLQMATLERGEALGDIMKRLEALERRLQGGAPTPPASPGPARAPMTSAATVRERLSGIAREAPPRTAPARPSVPPPPTGGSSSEPRATSSAAAPEPRVQGGVVAPAEAYPRGYSAGRPDHANAALGARERPSPDGPLSASEGDAVSWREVVVRVNDAKRMLGAFLEESRFLGRQGGDLVLAMDDLHRAVVEEKENRAIVLQHAREVFAMPLGVRCVPAVPGSELVRATPADVTPLIDQAIAWFDGDVIEPGNRGKERIEK